MARDRHRSINVISEATIKALRPILANHGLPELIVSDNGTSFTSSEFQEFTKRNGIRHITTAPYHPATNGLAERAVQTLKEGRKKSANGDLETRLAQFLFKYRTTPHSTTGVSPAELLMGRKLRSHLDLVQPVHVFSNDRHHRRRDMTVESRRARLRLTIKCMCVTLAVDQNGYLE